MIETLLQCKDAVKITNHAYERYAERVLQVDNVCGYLSNICNRLNIKNNIIEIIKNHTGYYVDYRKDDYETTLHVSLGEVVLVFKGLRVVTVMKTRVYDRNEISYIEGMMDRYRLLEPHIARDYAYLLYGSGVLKGII